MSVFPSNMDEVLAMCDDVLASCPMSERMPFPAPTSTPCDHIIGLLEGHLEWGETDILLKASQASWGRRPDNVFSFCPMCGILLGNAEVK